MLIRHSNITDTQWTSTTLLRCVWGHLRTGWLVLAFRFRKW